MVAFSRLALVFALLLVLVAPLIALAGSGSSSVRGYTRKDGTYVQPYQRSKPDRNPYNNYGTAGNYNPNRGEITPGDREKYIERYNERKGGSGYRLPKTGTDD